MSVADADLISGALAAGSEVEAYMSDDGDAVVLLSFHLGETQGWAQPMNVDEARRLAARLVAAADALSAELHARRVP